jgi:UDP-N-acetylmuramoylalanine--D-glutamate ligase
MDFIKKRVTVLGLSESGFSAIKLLKNVKAEVRISELRDEKDVRAKLKMLGKVEAEIGAHTKQFIEKSDLIVASPGVSPDAEPFRWAAERGIPIISELELGHMFCNAPIIAVTGTNGKSTTATLIHKMFESNGIDSYLLGNIGRPICEDVLRIPPDSVAVLEVSSFQLETIKKFRPKIALLLNITQDHLDRYRGMDEYIKAKLRIFENQESSDYAILNYDAPSISELSDKIKSNVFYFSTKQKVKGGYVENFRLFIDLEERPVEICHVDDIKLSGTHNLENILASTLALKLIDKKANALSVIGNFTGLRHRFELVTEINGIKFIDDSKGTTVDSTLRALEVFSEREVILIAGGRDKGSDYLPVAQQIEKLKYLIVIGEARKKIKSALIDFGITIEEAETMKDAVCLAMKYAKEGDTVLLSPMCSSFDMYKDYKERGEAFKKAIFNSQCIAKGAPGYKVTRTPPSV